MLGIMRTTHGQTLRAIFSEYECFTPLVAVFIPCAPNSVNAKRLPRPRPQQGLAAGVREAEVGAWDGGEVGRRALRLDEFERRF